MKFFTVGPCELYPSTKSILNGKLDYFRSSEFSNLVKSSMCGLSNLLGNPDRLIYLTSSGTGAMEAVVDNLFYASDKVLVINGGTFGQRWCQLLNHYSIRYDSVDLNYGEVLTKEKITEKLTKSKYTALMVNIHETSTGQLYDLDMLKNIAKEYDLFFVVDAISSFLADKYSCKGVDVTVISSHKGLCLSPGLAYVGLSEKAIERVKDNPRNLYFKFVDYLKNMERNQTPYTPAVFGIYELADMLKVIESEGGIEKRLETVAERAKYFRSKINLEIPNFPLSNAITPVMVDNAKKVFEYLKSIGITVNPCGGELADKCLRISHIGNLSLVDYDFLIEELNKFKGDQL